jgi:hypothetical protein
MVDDSTRKRPVLVADSPVSGAQVVRELDCLRARQTLNPVNDNGTGLTSNAILRLQPITRRPVAPRRASRCRTPSRYRSSGAGTNCSPTASVSLRAARSAMNLAAPVLSPRVKALGSVSVRWPAFAFRRLVLPAPRPRALAAAFHPRGTCLSMKRLVVPVSVSLPSQTRSRTSLAMPSDTSRATAFAGAERCL